MKVLRILGCAGLLAATGAFAQGMAKMAMPKVELGSSAMFAPDGALLAVAKQGSHVMLYRSEDAGRNWGVPQVVNAQPEQISADGENRPKLAVSGDGVVLVSWTRPLGKPYSGEIRLARSTDGGVSFSAPLTVHHDRQEITHRFETMTMGDDGRVYLAWIDKRDLEVGKNKQPAYRGAAIYAAVSEDGGRSFLPETKVADHSCECCRIAAAIDPDGAPVLLWRHVFEPNERDHAIARLDASGRTQTVARATFDRWKIDACPHHGPGLAIAPDGTRHAVWFNQKEEVGHVYYGRLEPGRVLGQRPVGGARAAHADIAIAGRRIAIVWKEFDGERTRLWAEISDNEGASFRVASLAATEKASDQPRALRRGDELFVFWHTEKESMRAFPLQ